MKPSILIALLLILSGCGEQTSSLKEAWDIRNDPRLMGEGYEMRFEALPASGRIDGEVWADDYWASRNGGLSFRWQTSEISYPFAKIDGLSKEVIARLSPAEKFDLYRGDGSWSLTRRERMRTRVLATVPGSSEYIPGFSIPGWEGLCHGWAPASMIYREPKSVVLKNPQGVEIEFASSDIKALLTYNIHGARPHDKKLIGARCESASDSSHISCRDANAASFHLILSNEVGMRKKPFIIDASAGDQVWNHPVIGYSFQAREPVAQATAGAARGTVYEVEVRTDMTMLVESAPHHAALAGQNSQYERTRSYQYVLELDAQKRIIGGRWLTQDHPDFIWRQGAPAISPELEGLQFIYRAATGDEIPLGPNGMNPPLNPAPDGWVFD